jgi:hypothetical protein
MVMLLKLTVPLGLVQSTQPEVPITLRSWSVTARAASGLHGPSPDPLSLPEDDEELLEEDDELSEDDELPEEDNSELLSELPGPEDDRLSDEDGWLADEPPEKLGWPEEDGPTEGVDPWLDPLSLTGVTLPCEPLPFEPLLR